MPAIVAKNVDFTVKPKKIVFDDDGKGVTVKINKTEKIQPTTKQHAAKNAPTASNNKVVFDVNGNAQKSQKIRFTDDGEAVPASNIGNVDEKEEEDYFAKREQKHQNKQKQQHDDDVDGQKKWYQVYTQYPSSDEVLDLKENEQMELYNICQNAFEAEKPVFNKRNPNDARWLHTALHKGTAKDRANAGALLVTSNPLGNLEALTTLIGFSKISNKASVDIINVLLDLWKEVLLPPQRKLLSVQARGEDWKLLRKDAAIPKEKQRRIFAYWYFEHELKDNYFEFLKNLMQGLQTGQENNKNSAISAAAQLLVYAPEKEQMLLTMLINKLGDPVAKVASKALHHLSDVAHRHPNMCGVIVGEAEKLLFRNNISDRAQHFALCFLASIAPAGRPEVCSKLVNICFSLFKVLVQKGAVNNRTMQAILRCLQKAILEAKPAAGSSEILTKEMQDTVYRLVHLADIRVSVQTLGLLLQLITLKTEKSDRFYNALYIKLMDLNMINIGVKTSAQLLHIVHRAIHIDTHLARAQAFIKRLLQLSLYTQPQMSAGCLVVIHKLLRTRQELLVNTEFTSTSALGALQQQVKVTDIDLAKFDSDGEEKYEDVPVEGVAATTEVGNDSNKSKPSSWHHAKVVASTDSEAKVRDMAATKYDAYHRVPAYAGAENALCNELHLLRQHYHPTVQVFADNILNQRRIEYYGDPLRDFGLPHFLERFAFKNPKKLEKDKDEATNVAHRQYVARGARGKPVKSLTKANCTEDEMYIFNYLEHKRQQAQIVEQAKKNSQKVATADDNDDDDDESGELLAGEVDDNEFEAYLDGYFGKKALRAGEEEEDLDFLQELGGDFQSEKSKTKKKNKKVDEANGVDDIDADWGDDNDAADDDVLKLDGSDASDDEAGSIDFDNDDSDDDGSISLDETMGNNDDDDDDDEGDTDSDRSGPDSNDDDEDLDIPKSKKPRKQPTLALNERVFSQKLKHSTDMSSLFAAADDFAELLEETGKTKGQGTINAVYNKDKSSDKQLKWEEKRRSNSKQYTSKKSSRKHPTGGGKKFLGKRKHL